MLDVRRGEVYYVDFGEAYGSEQGGIRPAVITQNDMGNRFSPTTIVVPITSQKKGSSPTHAFIGCGEAGLLRDSVTLAEQVRVIDKSRIKAKLGVLSDVTMKKIDKTIDVSLARTSRPVANFHSLITV